MFRVARHVDETCFITNDERIFFVINAINKDNMVSRHAMQISTQTPDRGRYRKLWQARFTSRASSASFSMVRRSVYFQVSIRRCGNPSSPKLANGRIARCSLTQSLPRQIFARRIETDGHSSLLGIGLLYFIYSSHDFDLKFGLGSITSSTNSA